MLVRNMLSSQAFLEGKLSYEDIAQISGMTIEESKEIQRAN